MKRWATQAWVILSLLGLVCLGLNPVKVQADVNDCLAFFSSSSLTPNSQSSLNLQVNNGDGDPIQWIKIKRPNSMVTILSSRSRNWTTANDSSSVTYSDSVLAPGAAYNQLFIDVETSADESSAAAWVVEASSDPSGANPVTCQDLGLSLSVSDGSGPTLSDITVDTIYPQSVTISWVSDEPATSQVRYGTSRSYGQTSKLDSRLTTEHSVTLTDLTANSGYHFQVVGSDGADNESQSGDSTFITAIATSAKSTDLSLVTQIPVKTVPSEHVAPKIQLTSDLTKPFKTVPTISGTASDNEALAGIGYSLDGGQNWLPVDTVTGLGSKTATFSFTPLNVDDGDYRLLVRAVDTSKNQATTDSVTMVIDRADPLVGGIVVALGPQSLLPSSLGIIETVTGVDQRVTLSAIGGPTHITLLAQTNNRSTSNQTFTLTKSTDNGLWSGLLSFDNAGKYQLIADSIDGAGNATSRVISTIHVSQPARVTDQKTQKQIHATVTLFVYENESHNWAVWDSGSYRQTNPQKTDKDGNFNFFLPPGKYYLKSQAPGFQTTFSTIFTLNHSAPFVTNLQMEPARVLHLGPFTLNTGGMSLKKLSVQTQSKSSTGKTQSSRLINKPAPDFSLVDTEGATIHPADVLGRPTLLTFTTSWSPTTSEQLAALVDLQSNKDIAILPVALQEDVAKLQAYMSITGRELRWLVDPKGTTISSYDAVNIPTHYFIDRKGNIREVKVGILTKQQIMNELGSL